MRLVFHLIKEFYHLNPSHFLGLILILVHRTIFFLALSFTAETILGRHSTMEIRSIHLGGLFHAEEEIQMTSTMASFAGQMQGFVYNGHRYIE